MLNFKGMRFPIDVILVCIRWYVAYPLSYRHLEEIMEERGVSVDHSSINRWAIRFLPLIEKMARKHKRPVGGSWRMDETYIKVKGVWKYLNRAVDKQGKNIGYCNAHGTATRIGDTVECEALGRVWGDAIGDLAVSSTKSMPGHLLGAAGALEAIITVMSVYRGAIAPNMHCGEHDPMCNVALVREPGWRAPGLHAAISNSFAFGGTNATLVFKRAM
jgi:3-oxoacyl-(acyl-carrier-protein) synthase